MKYKLLNLLVVLLAAVPRLSAQTADQLVTDGRAFLATRNLTNANAKFAAALAVSPTHETANALYGGTRVLTLPYRPAGSAFLDRLGFSNANRSIYHWKSGVPRDTNHAPVN